MVTQRSAVDEHFGADVNRPAGVRWSRTELISVTDGRLILAYNSRPAFDTVMRESERCGLDPEHLEDLTNWRSIAQARSTWLGHLDHYLPIPRTTRALGQCHAALQVLQDIAAN